MNLNVAEPQGISGVFRNGWSLFKTGFSSLWMLALAAGLLNTWFGVYTEYHPEVAGGASLGILTLSLLSTGLGGLLSLIMLRRLDNLARGLLVDLDDEFNVAIKAFLPFVLASLLYGLGIVVGAIVLIVPGIFILVAFGFYSMFLVLEGRGPIKALEASFRLVEGQWWYAFGALLLILVVAVTLVVLCVLPVALLLEGEGPAAFMSGWAADIAFGGLLNMLLEPLGLALSLCLFYELKARKTGLASQGDE